MFDISVVARNMNGLKVVSAEIAKILIQRSMPVAQTAIDFGARSNLPGGETRKNTLAHLQWHADKLVTLVRGGLKLNAVYPHGDDLKKWATQAYIEANAVGEGLDQVAAAWNQMWAEVVEAIKNIPETVLKAAGSIASGALKGAIEGIFGVPWWVVLIGATTVTAGVGYGIYRLRSK